MFAALDMSKTAHFEPRHDPPLGRLTDQLAIQKSDHVDGIVKSDAKFAAAGPRDLSSWSLASGNLDRHALTKRWDEVAAYRHSKRRDFPNLAVLAYSQMINRRRIERPPLGRSR